VTTDDSDIGRRQWLLDLPISFVSRTAIRTLAAARNDDVTAICQRPQRAL